MKKRTPSQINAKIPTGCKLVVIEFDGYRVYKDGVRLRMVKCKCVCGKFRTVLVKQLLNGKVKSCGCSHKTNKTHGMSNGRHPLYSVWSGIKKRCFDVKYSGYKRYGGRGITVCKSWRVSFEHFYKWSISNGWSKGLQIDRINNNGNYSPKNCRYTTSKINSNNRRNSVLLTHNGKSLSMNEWSEVLDIPKGTIMYRYLLKWPTEKILSTERFYTNKNQYGKFKQNIK